MSGEVAEKVRAEVSAHLFQNAQKYIFDFPAFDSLTLHLTDPPMSNSQPRPYKPLSYYNIPPYTCVLESF